MANDDGTIDYSGCSDRELQEVLSVIDQKTHPKNYAKLVAEFERRRANSPEEEKSERSGIDKTPEQIKRQYSSLLRKQAVVSAIVVAVWAPEIIAGFLGFDRFLGLGELDWLVIKVISLMPLFWFLLFIYECPSCGNFPGGGWTRRNCKSCGVQLKD